MKIVFKPADQCDGWGDWYGLDIGETVTFSTVPGGGDIVARACMLVTVAMHMVGMAGTRQQHRKCGKRVSVTTRQGERSRIADKTTRD